MIGQKIKHFIEYGDFDTIMDWISNADPASVLLNPFILIPVLIIVGLIVYPKTSDIGQSLVLYVPAAGFLFITGVVLKNDVISNIGPFIMAMVAFFMIIGWLVYTQLLKS